MQLPDRYRLEHGIAAGGMATVYAAHDTVLNRAVAVKVLADHLNDDVTARARFEREARAAAALSNHPGVVTIFDVGEHDGRAFMVMELRDGGTIADAGRVEEGRALGWLRTIADAVDAGHERGIVHRDLKPGNLLLDDRDGVAVADFGIASVAEETERFTQTGQVLGTAAYLSPEQAMGETATPASDRYALAVVAYELLTGEKPFRTANFAAVARAHIEDPPPDAPGLPPEAQQVLKRGLAKAPSDRWPTARAMVDALDTALGAAPPPPPEPTVATRAMAASPPPPRRRRTGTLLVAAAAALVLAAAGAIALTGGEDEPKTAEQPAATTKPKKKPKKEATPEPTAEPTVVEEAPTEEPTTEPVSDLSTATDLNNEGYAIYQQGDYEAAIDPLTQAVEACGDAGDLDPCGFAIYNLGSALHRAGRSEEAIPVLERRLAGWNYKRGVVQAELDAARAAVSGEDDE